MSDNDSMSSGDRATRDEAATPGTIAYTRRERFWLTAVAIGGAVGLNGAFVLGAARPDVAAEALGNPIAVAFALEAFVLVGVLAYLLERWRVARLRWPWLVGLSLLGGLAFALPVVLLWREGPARSGGSVSHNRRG